MELRAVNSDATNSQLAYTCIDYVKRNKLKKKLYRKSASNVERSKWTSDNKCKTGKRCRKGQERVSEAGYILLINCSKLSNKESFKGFSRQVGAELF